MKYVIVLLLLLATTQADELNKKKYINNVVESTIDTVSATFNYTPDTYIEKFSKIKNAFTIGGWKRYSNALNKSGNIKFMKDNQLIVYATRLGEPNIITSNQNTIIFSIPFSVSYLNNIFTLQQDILSKVTLVRIINKENTNTYKINNIYSYPLSDTKYSLVTVNVPEMCK